MPNRPRRSLVLFVLLLLTGALSGHAWAQTAPGGAGLEFEARFAIEGPQGQTIRVAVLYRGTYDEGRGVVIYTMPNGTRIRDTLNDCTLTSANGTWKIDCTNPHYTSLDGVRFHYIVSSPLVTQGRLRTLQLRKTSTST